MTDKELFKKIRALGLSVRKSDNEYKIWFQTKHGENSYYTNDKDDAYGTALHMVGRMQRGSVLKNPAPKMARSASLRAPAHMSITQTQANNLLSQHVKTIGRLSITDRSLILREHFPHISIAASKKLAKAFKPKKRTLKEYFGIKNNPRSVGKRAPLKKAVRRVTKRKKAKRNPIIVLHPYVITGPMRRGGAIVNMYWNGEKFTDNKKEALYFDTAKEAMDFAQTIVKRLPYQLEGLRVRKARDA